MTEANKKAVSTFFEKFSAGDTQGAFDRVSDDATWWVPGTLPFSGTKTKAGYMAIVARIKDGFPNGFKLVVKAMIGEGDTVAAEVESEGDHMSGKAYRNKYHFLITLKDGRMIAVKEYMDTLHLAQVIGMVPG